MFIRVCMFRIRFLFLRDDVPGTIKIANHNNNSATGIIFNTDRKTVVKFNGP